MNVQFFMDFFGFFPLYFTPGLKIFVDLAIIPVVIFNIWSLLYFIAPYRFELSFVLFQGLWGVFTSFLFFLVAEKFFYHILHIESFLFFYLGLVFYLMSLVGVIVIEYLWVYDKVKIPEGPGSWPKAMAFVPALSYMIGQFIFTAIKNENITGLIFAGIISLAMFIPFLFVRFVHQYFFLIGHKETLKARDRYLCAPKKDRPFDGKEGKKRRKRSRKKKRSM